jgi:BirA family biotin operon repressor/biotin-[acetyl-CoA-carboxylase] ligase
VPKPVAFEPAMRRALGGRDARIVERCASTNDLARAWARDGAPHLAIVVADAQDAGRGRHGRAWVAAPGSALLCSIVVRPALEASRWGLLPLLAGVAAADAIDRRTGVGVGLKWPNDLVVDECKLGGILCEADPGAWAVIGIGINVSAAPAGAASLADAGASRLDRADLAAALLGALEVALGDPDDALERYRSRSVTVGRRVCARTLDGSAIVGEAVEIAEDGALVIEEGAVRHRVDAADVEHLRPDVTA